MTTTTKPVAAVYARLSHNPSGTDSQSVRDQITTMTITAQRAGYEVGFVLRDDGVGASRYSRGKRDGYGALLGLIGDGSVRAVAVWEASRLSRDMADWIALRDLCEAKGVLLITASGTLDMNNDGDRLSGGVLGLVAEQASRDTSRRVKRSRDAAAAAGLPIGRATYGYRRLYGEAGRLVGVEVVEPEAAVLRRAARHVLRGGSLTRLVADLNTQGVPSPAMAVAARLGRPVTPSGWTVTSLRRLLTSPAYAGLRVHRGAVIGDAAWAPLWDAEAHRRLTALFGTRATGTRQREIRHWLSGILFCDLCQQPLRVMVNKGSAAYACAVPCRKVSVAKDKIEATVTNLVIHRVATGRMRREDGEQVAVLRNRLSEARERLATASEAFAEGRIGVGTLSAVESRLLDVQRALEAELARATGVSTDVDPDEVLHRWDQMPPDRRRSVTRLVVGRIDVRASEGRYVDVLTRLRFPDLRD